MTPFEDELERLEGEVVLSRERVSTLTLDVRCPAGAELVVRRVTDVMRPLVSARIDDAAWPTVEAWERALPSWFVDACAEQKTVEEAEAYLTWWRRLSRTQLIAEEREKRWALADFLYWFEPGPSERQWRWHHAKPIDDQSLRLEIEVAGHPTAYGALTWLLRAAGATEVQE